MRGLPQPRQGRADTGISSTASRRVLPARPRLASSQCASAPQPVARGPHTGACTLQVALQGSAMDPTTGTIDMDLIQTGISAGARTARAQLTQELRTLIQSERLPPPPQRPSPSTLCHSTETRLSVSPSEGCNDTISGFGCLAYKWLPWGVGDGGCGDGACGA